MNDNQDNPNPRVARIALVGATITGIAGVILAINAALDDQFTGAGLLLIASALAFGLLGHRHHRD